MQWFKYRRSVLLYNSAVFCVFIIVYALNGYDWSVAGYAIILSTAMGLAVGIRDFISFYRKNAELRNFIGNFPTAELPAAGNLTEENYLEIILALEAERKRLEEENDTNRRDAGEYYTLWAHQIKTPIAATKLLLESRNSGIDPGARDILEQELLKINQYADMALQYRRLSSFENDLKPEKFSLLYLVKQAAKNCAPLFIYKGLSLNIEDVSGVTVTDKKWFCFVIEQLLTNAVKYTPAGTINVYGKTGDLLIIEDCGTGIPPEDLPRVFELGFTGAHGREERSSTGIGLYLSRRVLLKLGYNIRIESEAGKGTRVFLYLAQIEAETD